MEDRLEASLMTTQVELALSEAAIPFRRRDDVPGAR